MLAHSNLVHPKVLRGEPFYFRKELQIFSNTERMNQGKEFWLSHYPKCTNYERLVATDMTPNYLSVAETPERMKLYYGTKSHRIRFAIIIRNPVDRIRSCFRFFQKRGWCAQKYIDNGFKAYVRGLIYFDFDPCSFLEGSKYHKQIQRFLEVFE
jgi:hypothetical protein